MKIILIILMLLITTIAYADEYTIMGSCYPKKIQQQFADKGLKLDLSGNDRTPDSFGFILNEGTQFKIFTYKELNEEEMTLMLKIIMR